MSGSDGSDERPYYGRARTVGGVGILLLITVLFIIDRPPDSFALAMMLTTSLLLLGVEGARLLLGR